MAYKPKTEHLLRIRWGAGEEKSGALSGRFGDCWHQRLGGEGDWRYISADDA